MQAAVAAQVQRDRYSDSVQQTHQAGQCLILRKQIDRRHTAAAWNGVAMIAVDSTVVLLGVVPRDVPDKADVTPAFQTGAESNALGRAVDFVALSDVLLQLYIPHRRTKVAAVTCARAAIPSTEAMHWAVRVLALLAAVARETLARALGSNGDTDSSVRVAASAWQGLTRRT